jgi:hypothetical protein
MKLNALPKVLEVTAFSDPILDDAFVCVITGFF